MKEKIKKAWIGWHSDNFEPDEIPSVANPCFDAGFKNGYRQAIVDVMENLERFDGLEDCD